MPYLLQYKGVKSPLELRMPWLSRTYTFKGKEPVWVVNEDALALLQDNPRMFNIQSVKGAVPQYMAQSLPATHEMMEPDIPDTTQSITGDDETDEQSAPVEVDEDAPLAPLLMLDQVRMMKTKQQVIDYAINAFGEKAAHLRLTHSREELEEEIKFLTERRKAREEAADL